jgi:transcriptional regulator with XRE-family HTH domain
MAKDKQAKTGSFAQRVKILREQKSLTATDLAKLANVTAAAVWNWEKHGRIPRSATVSTLANKLGVSEEYLLTGDRSDNIPSVSAIHSVVPNLEHGMSIRDASLEDLIAAIEAKGFLVSVRSRG